MGWSLLIVALYQPKTTTRITPPLKLKPQLNLYAAHRLCSVDGAEAGVLRQQACLVQRSVSVVLAVQNRRVCRAAELKLRYHAVVDHRIERVEEIDAQLPSSP
jgi:hypothetical protein